MSCKNVQLLRFDFVLKNKHNIKIIEYHGEQHYVPCAFGSRSLNQADINFEGVQKRDQIKRNWCRANRVPLLEIPYWDYNNIPKLVEDFVA